jgi:hypothetical protein
MSLNFDNWFRSSILLILGQARIGILLTFASKEVYKDSLKGSYNSVVFKGCRAVLLHVAKPTDVRRQSENSR